MITKHTHVVLAIHIDHPHPTPPHPHPPRISMAFVLTNTSIMSKVENSYFVKDLDLVKCAKGGFVLLLDSSTFTTKPIRGWTTKCVKKWYGPHYLKDARSHDVRGHQQLNRSRLHKILYLLSLTFGVT